MTEKERKIALYCLKANSDYHSEICEECTNYPNCDHTIHDDVTETIIKVLEQEPCEDAISRKAAIDALWKALYEYEDKTEKQFLESEELDIADWFQHRIFVQNMSDIDRQTILNLPPVTPQLYVPDINIGNMTESEGI